MSLHQEVRPVATDTRSVPGGPPAGPPAVRPFTRAEYHRLGQAGVIGPDERTELIEGVIYRMPPEGPGHNEYTRRLVNALARLSRPGVAQLSTGSLVVGDSEVVPDACLVHWRDDFYRGRLPTAADALLVVEVSHSMLAFDLSTKARLDAAAGIPEYWIVDVAARVLRVYIDPAPTATPTDYVNVEVRSEGEITPMVLPERPEYAVALADLFGPAP